MKMLGPRRIAEHLDYRRRQRRYPHIINSGVSHPELVHPTARVVGASLSGPVVVGEWAQVEGPLLLLGSIQIGRYTTINGPNTDIFARIHPVEIGAFCSIARSVSIQEYNHPTNRCATSYILERVFGDGDAAEEVSKGPILIGSDVWIGTQCILLPGSRIGNGAIIGANSVVTGDIPAFAIAVGSPARVIKYRFDESLRSALEDTRWWDWPRERLWNNRRLFEGELTAEKLAGAASE